MNSDGRVAAGRSPSTGSYGPLTADQFAERIAAHPNRDFILSHLEQIHPEKGCVQGCAHCSVKAKANIQTLTRGQLEIIFHGLGALYRDNRGISNAYPEIYTYRDNDSFLYPNMDVMARLAHEIGLLLRLSTQGFSADRDDLTRMHQRIAADPSGVSRVRYSYAASAANFGRRGPMRDQYRARYAADLGHAMGLYRDLVDETFARGREQGTATEQGRRVGVTLLHNPSVHPVRIETSGGRGGSRKISFGDTTYQVLDSGAQPLGLLGKDAEQTILVDGQGQRHTMIRFNLAKAFDVPESQQYHLITIDADKPYQVQNYFLDVASGVALSTDNNRYFSQAREMVRDRHGIGRDGAGATWSHVDDLLTTLNGMARDKPHVGDGVLPLIQALVASYKVAQYDPRLVFDDGFTRDEVVAARGRASRLWMGSGIPDPPDSTPRTWREAVEVAGLRKDRGNAAILTPIGGAMGVRQIRPEPPFDFDELEGGPLDFPELAMQPVRGSEMLPAQVGYLPIAPTPDRS